MSTIPDNDARVLALDARRLIKLQDGKPLAVEVYLRRIIDALPDPGEPTFLEQAHTVARLAPKLPEARAAEYANALMDIAKRADEAVEEAARTINALNTTQRDRLAEAGKASTRYITQLSGYRSLIDTDDVPDNPADARADHIFIGRVDGQITTVQRFIDDDPSDEYPWRDINADWHRDDDVELLAMILTDTDTDDNEED